MSNPACARARAATGGAVKAAPESSTWPVSAAIGLSRFPKVMSAPRNVSSSGRNEYSVSPAISRSRAVCRPRLMSPTAYRRSVPRAGGACSTASSTWHAATRLPVIAIESRRTCAPPSTVHQPREHFRGVDQARPRARGIGVAVEKLDAPVEQGPGVAVRDQGHLAARPLYVEATRRDDHEIGRQGAELPPRARHGRRAGNAADVLAPRDLDQLGDPVPRDVGRVEPFEHQDSRARGAARGPSYPPQPIGEPRDHLVRFVAQLHGLADLAHIDEHLDQRVRVEGHDPGCEPERGDDTGELLLAYRTDVADRLCDDDVRTQTADQVYIHLDGRGTLVLRRRQRRPARFRRWLPRQSGRSRTARPVPTRPGRAIVAAPAHATRSATGPGRPRTSPTKWRSAGKPPPRPAAPAPP